MAADSRGAGMAGPSPERALDDEVAGAGLPSGVGDVGADLRALRKARGMTLSELALQAGRSVGWLSQVERGLTSPSVSDLRKLAEIFGKSLSFFFGPQPGPEDERGYVVRGGSRRMLGSAAEGLSEELLSPDLGGDFEILRSVFDAGAERKDFVTRPTEEAGYLVSGELILWIGAREFHIRPGDSFRFRREPFRWKNPGTVPAVAVWVVSPPVY